MKLLLLGNTGQLGWELERTLQPLGEVVALDYPQVNMADASSICRIVREQKPRVIVNATAYTAVDRAESESALSNSINGVGPGILADEALKLSAVLIHYSTDYVFDGTKGTPYQESDLPHPLNVYGQSKLVGEQAIESVGGIFLIFRTAWVYSLRRDSFVSKVLGWARNNETLRIVDDQVSNPTWARMLAEVTAQVLARGENYLRDQTGLYHLAGGGYASRYAWAKEILALDPNPQEQIVKQILPACTKDFSTPARRPLFSALDCGKFLNTFGIHILEWNKGLSLAMNN
jgi:dTDP-4-dehydrorhamnose reductase